MCKIKTDNLFCISDKEMEYIRNNHKEMIKNTMKIIKNLFLKLKNMKKNFKKKKTKLKKYKYIPKI